ncbi:MAG: hypothetical protein MUC87_21360 [Bacteroidia bacterium]|jgi:hypothetical protein|nr:hypothetical protein [Bacteroidia bacterium]
MRVAIVILYFILAIIICASIGIWLPYIFELIKDGKHSKESMIQNIATYFLAIFFSAALDYFLKIMDKNDSGKKLKILILLIVIVIILFLSGCILYKNLHGQSVEVLGFSIFGVVASYIMWWVVNYSNSNFDPTSSIGGDPQKPLNNE